MPPVQHNGVSPEESSIGVTMDSSTATSSTSTSASVVVGKAGRGGGVGSASGSRSVSLASVSSDGSSSESHLVEQEDIVALTQEVRAFKEALGKLRRLFHPNDKGKKKLVQPSAILAGIKVAV